MEAIKESISQLSHMFNQKMTEFEERQQEIIPASPSTGNLSCEFSVFKTFTLNALRSLQAQVELLAQQTDNLEMHTRRKILLLHGISEDKTENASAIIENLIRQTLKLSDFQASDISRCHRMGGMSRKDRPRPILLKIQDMSLRTKIWAAKSNLKGSGITLSEFLTKSRHDAFMAARQRFGVGRCWTRDGVVFVLGADDRRHRINSVRELEKVGLPATHVHAKSARAVAAAVTVPSTAAASAAPSVRTKRVTKPKA